MNSATNIPVEVKKPSRFLSWLKVSLGAGLACAIVTLLGFLYFMSIVGNGPAGTTREADAIVVLTGGEARIPEAIKLLRQGRGQRLLISGVNPITTRRELTSLAPNSKRWFNCCIDVDQVARDTIGNANETRNWVEKRGFRSLIVVTASYHMPRSLAELRRALPDTEFIAYPVKPGNLRLDEWWTHQSTFQLLALEYVKFVSSFSRCLVVQIGRSRAIVESVRQCLNIASDG